MPFINDDTKALHERYGEMHAVLSWHEDPMYADINYDKDAEYDEHDEPLPKYPNRLPEEPQIIYERIPLNGTFTDNGLSLIYVAPNEPPVDISHKVQRYGHVNTNKVGEYVLKYFCEFRTWSRYYEDDNVVEPLVDFRWKKYRKIIVYEPEWLITTVPQLYQAIYPSIMQLIQRYQSIYWELDYKADNVRLGTKSSRAPVTKYRGDWTPPTGKIFAYNEIDNYWYIYGYTFQEGDYVEIDFSGENEFNGQEGKDIFNLFIFSVKQEDVWMADHSYSEDKDLTMPNYKAGSWVQFLDKMYLCHTDHYIVQNRHSKLKPQIIYPMDERYWITGCRVELAKYDYISKTSALDSRDVLRRDVIIDAAKVVGQPVLSKIYNKSTVKQDGGYSIRQRNIIVDSQGFLYNYYYEPLPLPKASLTPETIILDVSDEEKEYDSVISWQTTNVLYANISAQNGYTFEGKARLVDGNDVTINCPYHISSSDTTTAEMKNGKITYLITHSENAAFMDPNWKKLIYDDYSTDANNLKTNVVFTMEYYGIDEALTGNTTGTVNIHVPGIEIDFKSNESSLVSRIPFADPGQSTAVNTTLKWKVKNATEISGNAFTPSSMDGQTLVMVDDDSVSYTLVAKREAYKLKAEKTIFIGRTIEYEVIITGGVILNNTNSTTNSKYYVMGASVSFCANKPPDCQEFDRWEVESNGETGPVFVDKENSTSFNMPAHPLLLTALYKPKIYTITFNGNYNGSTSLPSDDVECGSLINKPTDPFRNGYNFMGWFTAAHNGIKWDFNSPIVSKMEFYAQWTPTVYTITYVDQGILNNPRTTYTIETSFSLGTPRKDNHTFIGWTMDGDTAPKTPMVIYGGHTGDIVFTAHWQIDTYVVTFYDGETMLKQDTVDYGSAATPPPDPSREGFTFVKWWPSFDSITQSLNVAAIYDPIMVTITFIDNDTEDSIGESLSIPYGSTLSEIHTSDRPCYRIVWGPPLPIENITSDMEMRGTYELIQHTIGVTIEPETGGIVEYESTLVDTSTGITINCGDGIELTATPNNGYTFVMWLEGEEDAGTDMTYVIDNVTHDYDLTAIFEEGEV